MSAKAITLFDFAADCKPQSNKKLHTAYEAAKRELFLKNERITVCI